MNIVRNFYIMCLIILSSCGGETEEKKENIAVRPENTSENERWIAPSTFEEEGMELISPEEQEFFQTIQTTGMIDVPPENKAYLNAFIGGYVKGLHLLEGEAVAKGDLLLRLENTEYIEIQQSYLETVEQLSYLKSDFERQETMYDENITSQKSYLKAESEYKTAVAKAKGLREKLQMLHISPGQVENGNFTSSIPVYAPIGGNISNIRVAEGMYVSPTQTVLEIVNSEELHLELNIFEKDLLKLKEGQQVQFSLTEVGNNVLAAEVRHIGRALDRENRTVKVHAHLKEPLKQNLAVGMFVQAVILTDAEHLPAIPNAAIQGAENNFFIWILKERTSDHIVFERVPIELQAKNQEYSAIMDPQKIQGKSILLEKQRSL